MKGKKSFNTIYSQMKDDRSWYNSVEETKDVIVNYYHNLLGKNDQAVEDYSINDLHFYLGNSITNEDYDFLILLVSDEEIKSAMFSIQNSKSPGPDGFSTYFYKSSWN